MILDFEAYAVVIRSRRQFLPVHLFTMFAALLLAEGEELPTLHLYAMAHARTGPDTAYAVNRDVRRLRGDLDLADAGIEIAASRRGYTLRRLDAGQ